MSGTIPLSLTQQFDEFGKPLAGGLLYIYQAGNTIDLYDAATFQYLRTISLDADMTTGLYVMPGR